MAAAGAGRAARMHFPLLRVGARWLFWRVVYLWPCVRTRSAENRARRVVITRLLFLCEWRRGGLFLFVCKCSS